MGEKLIRESLDEYAALHTPETDLWPGLMSQLQGAQMKRHDSVRGWVPEGEKELTWPSVVGSTGERSHPARTGRRAFLAATTTSLATLLLAILGTLGLLSFMSFAPGAGGSRGSEPLAAVPPKADATATPAPPEAETAAPRLHYLPPEGPDNYISAPTDLAYVERLGTKLDISQTVGGYTVTLLRAYADANQIVVVYNVQGPEDSFTSVLSNALVDRDSPAVFAPMFGYAERQGSQPGTHAYFFDASALDQLPGELRLGLSFELSRGDRLGLDLPALPDTKEETSFSEVGMRQLLADTGRLNPRDLLSPFGQEIVAGPFQFDFTVPVTTTETRAAAVNQTVEAAGVKITLDKVVATPGATRLTFSFEGATAGEGPWQPVLSLVAGDYDSADAPGGLMIETASSDGKGTWTYSLAAPLTDKQGEWTATISELRSGHPLVLRDGLSDGGLGDVTPGSGEQKTLSGPWVFKFTLPPAQTK